MIQACAGVDVIPWGPLEGGHMACGCVEMTERDDSPLLSWLPRFAAQVMNKMSIGSDGKTSELTRTGRRWRTPTAQ